MRWTRKNIVAEIRRLHADDVELNYSSAEANYLYLVRAAAWHYGTWRHAIEAAGFEYDSLAKYQRWDRKRIVTRIRELHAQGFDLNWRAVSQEVDPPLAAAALRANGFESWREAIAAAGLDIDEIARYKYWTPERVLREIRAYHKAGQPLSSKAMQEADQSLFCAARRRFGSWDQALAAAGFEVSAIRLRQPGTRRVKEKGKSLKLVKRSSAGTRVAPPGEYRARPKDGRKSVETPPKILPRAVRSGGRRAVGASTGRAR